VESPIPKSTAYHPQYPPSRHRYFRFIADFDLSVSAVTGCECHSRTRYVRR